LGKTKKTKNGGTIREAIKSIETIGERKTRKIDAEYGQESNIIFWIKKKWIQNSKKQYMATEYSEKFFIGLLSGNRNWNRKERNFKEMLHEMQ